MEMNYQTLISIEKMHQDPDYVFNIVDSYGQAVLLRHNAPAYVITNPQQNGNGVNPICLSVRKK